MSCIDILIVAEYISRYFIVSKHFSFQFPFLDSHILKTSGLGKSVMLVYRHPKELKKNKERAEKLISKYQESYLIIVV